MVTLDNIVNLAKRRGFITPSSEIYGGFSSSYDYGPLGVELKNNIKRAWWKTMVYGEEHIVGLDSAILMNPKIWEASGHLGAGFTDPLVECKKCHHRFRKDQLEKSTCPDCGGELTGEIKFNLMMKTNVGPVEDKANEAYLRAETAQGIYVNYDWVQEAMRMKPPFGIAQIGKAFRNEITPGNFVYRMREFEQMEMQFFIRADEHKKWFAYWKQERMSWYLSLGITKDRVRFEDHKPDELAHYAKAACDIQYRFPEPLGWQEVEGIHYRGDWDLSNHAKFSGKELVYFDQETKEKFTPHVIETSAGADRSALMFLVDAYDEGEARTTTTEAAKEKEVTLKLHPRLAPVKAAVLPLVKNKPPVVELAKSVLRALRESVGGVVQYDEAGSIGRRYRRHDEIGTPYCITVDFDSLEKKDVTVRDRDSMSQERVPIEDLADHIAKKVSA